MTTNGNAPLAALARLRTALGAALIERADETDAVLVALIAREHILFCGVPGCLHADTPIYDPTDGTTESVLTRTLRGSPFHVWARDPDSGAMTIAAAAAPWQYEPADMFTLHTTRGHEVTVTGAHRLWMGERFERVSEAATRLRESGRVPMATISGTVPSTRAPGVARSTRTAEGSQSDCPHASCSDGAPLPGASDSARGAPPSPSGARGHTRPLSRTDDLADTASGSRDSTRHRRATSSYEPRTERQTASAESAGLAEARGESLPSSCPAIEPSHEGSRSADTPAPAERVQARPTAAHARTPEGEQTSVASSLAFVAQSSRRMSEYNRTEPQSGTASAHREGVEGPLHQAAVYAEPSFDLEQWQVDHIIAIEPVGRHPYYDFHVPGFENYWACGMVHHNTAKSAAARNVARGIRGCRYVERLLAPTTPPEALWGPISLAALRQDRYEHITTGTVADAELVFLDEVGRASPAILDTLLHLLGPERQALIGTMQVKAPLVTAIGAANTWPEDAAMLDRWLVRRVVKPISRGSLSRLMWDELPDVEPCASLDDLATAHMDALELPVSVEAKQALADAVSELAAEGIRPSDRRLRASVRIARASAVLIGAAEVEPAHLTALADVLWNRPEDAGKAGDIIRRVANPTLARLTQLLANTDECVETAKASPNDAAVRIEAIQKLNEMLKESEKLRGKKGTYDKNGRAAHITTYIRQQAAELQMAALGMDPAKASALMNMDDDA